MLAIANCKSNAKSKNIESESSKQGLIGCSMKLHRCDERWDIPESLNGAARCAINAVRLSSASLAERTVCNGRTTVQRPLIDASVSNRCAEESQAR